MKEWLKENWMLMAGVLFAAAFFAEEAYVEQRGYCIVRHSCTAGCDQPGRRCLGYRAPDEWLRPPEEWIKVAQPQGFAAGNSKEPRARTGN